MLFPEPHLAVGRRVDSVVVHSALVAQRDGPLAGAALALAHQEAAVDARAEQVLGGVARHGPVVPAMLLQAVDGGDVVGWHPALAILGLRLAPFAIVVVAEHAQLLPWTAAGRETGHPGKSCSTKLQHIPAIFFASSSSAGVSCALPHSLFY